MPRFPSDVCFVCISYKAPASLQTCAGSVCSSGICRGCYDSQQGGRCVACRRPLCPNCEIINECISCNAALCSDCRHSHRCAAVSARIFGGRFRSRRDRMVAPRIPYTREQRRQASEQRFAPRHTLGERDYLPLNTTLCYACLNNSRSIYKAADYKCPLCNKRFCLFCKFDHVCTPTIPTEAAWPPYVEERLPARTHIPEAFVAEMFVNPQLDHYIDVARVPVPERPGFVAAALAVQREAGVCQRCGKFFSRQPSLRHYPAGFCNTCADQVGS